MIYTICISSLQVHFSDCQTCIRYLTGPGVASRSKEGHYFTTFGLVIYTIKIKRFINVRDNSQRLLNSDQQTTRFFKQSFRNRNFQLLSRADVQQTFQTQASTSIFYFLQLYTDSAYAELRGIVYNVIRLRIVSRLENTIICIRRKFLVSLFIFNRITFKKKIELKGKFATTNHHLNSTIGVRYLARYVVYRYNISFLNTLISQLKPITYHCSFCS